MANKLYKKVERCFNAGEVIFEQGAACDGIYSLKTGSVSVYKSKPTPGGLVEMEIVKLGPGSMFGEMGMLGQAKRDASVKALEYTECIVITPEMFESQMSSLPPWVVNFIKILVNRLRGTNDRLLSAMQTLESHGLAPTDAPGGPAPESAAAPGSAAEPAAAEPPASPASSGSSAKP